MHIEIKFITFLSESSYVFFVFEVQEVVVKADYNVALGALALGN